MAKKLDYGKSAQIVESALREIGGISSFDSTTRLGDLLATPAIRDAFRHRVKIRVRSEGFGIRWKSIPLDPHITVHHVTLALTGLAGDPGVDDD
jgi:hypothetical protein